MNQKSIPNLSLPFEEAIGPTSPFPQMVRLIKEIARHPQFPIIQSGAAQNASHRLCVHVLHLIEGAGQLNGAGYHSASVALFRPIEDAIDTFAAISMVPGAVELWYAGKLKASDAAKEWTSLVGNSLMEAGITVSEYRKWVRSNLNEYSHCSSELTYWNLYRAPVADDPDVMTLELNLIPVVINSNGHQIDAHLTASLWEFKDIVKLAYESYLTAHHEVRSMLTELENELLVILNRHKQHGCFDFSRAIEVAHLKPR